MSFKQLWWLIIDWWRVPVPRFERRTPTNCLSCGTRLAPSDGEFCQSCLAW